MAINRAAERKKNKAKQSQYRDCYLSRIKWLENSSDEYTLSDCSRVGIAHQL
jgi:hypothetical protein